MLVYVICHFFVIKISTKTEKNTFLMINAKCNDKMKTNFIMHKIYKIIKKFLIFEKYLIFTEL